MYILSFKIEGSKHKYIYLIFSYLPVIKEGLSFLFQQVYII